MEKRSLLEVLSDIKKRFPRARNVDYPEWSIGDTLAVFNKDLHEARSSGYPFQMDQAKAWMEPHYWYEVERKQIKLKNDERPEQPMMEFTKGR